MTTTPFSLAAAGEARSGAAVEPQTKLITLDANSTRRVKDLRRRGWSIAGIARHLGVDRDLVAGALGEGSVMA